MKVPIANRKQNKQNKQQKTNKNRQKQRGGASRGNSAQIPCWAASVLDPFDRPACHVPDENISESGAVKSWIRHEYTLNAASGTAVGHNGGVICFPHAEAGIVTLREETPGIGRLYAVTDSGPPPRQSLSNVSSFASNCCQTRTTAMGIRVAYTGTELNRSGKYYAGLLPINEYCLTNTGTYHDPLSCGGINRTAGGTGFAASYAIGDIKSQLVHLTEGRIGDGNFHAVWRPAQSVRYSYNGKNYVVPMTGTAGERSESIWSAAEGNRGATRGQFALVVLIVGDTTSTGSINGNTYSVQFVMHNEVIPDNSNAVTFSIEPSTFDVLALQKAINLIGASRVATTIDTPVEISSSHTEPTFMAYSSMAAGAREAIGKLTGNAVQFASNVAYNVAMRAIMNQGNALVPRY